jgi:hypothetical protein
VSFDLAVWFEAASSLAPEAAGEKYGRLCGEDLAGVVPSERVSAFYGALTATYPEIDTVRDEDIDACPWIAAMDVSPGHVIMPIAWSRAEEIGSAVRTLARRWLGWAAGRGALPAASRQGEHREIDAGELAALTTGGCEACTRGRSTARPRTSWSRDGTACRR